MLSTLQGGSCSPWHTASQSLWLCTTSRLLWQPTLWGATADTPVQVDGTTSIVAAVSLVLQGRPPAALRSGASVLASLVNRFSPGSMAICLLLVVLLCLLACFSRVISCALHGSNPLHILDYFHSNFASSIAVISLCQVSTRWARRLGSRQGNSAGETVWQT